MISLFQYLQFVCLSAALIKLYLFLFTESVWIGFNRNTPTNIVVDELWSNQEEKDRLDHNWPAWWLWDPMCCHTVSDTATGSWASRSFCLCQSFYWTVLIRKWFNIRQQFLNVCLPLPQPKQRVSPCRLAQENIACDVKVLWSDSAQRLYAVSAESTELWIFPFEKLRMHLLYYI